MKWVVFIFILIVLGVVAVSQSLSLFGQRQAALQVSSAPQATVFLNGQHVGQTPFFDDKLKSGEYTLKLVPEVGATALLSWEGKIVLTPQILTVVSRQFGSTDAQSSGEMITLEPLSSRTKTSLAVVSLPDSAVVKLNGLPKGFTPLHLDEIAPGEQTLVLAAAGYQEKTLRVKAVAGHKLTVSAQLAQAQVIEVPEPEAEATPAAQPEILAPGQVASASAQTKTKPYVEILDNSLGFLRVRAEPSTQATEVAQAVPGQRLPYLHEEENGWYKVTWAAGKTGWVARGTSGEYARLVQ